LHLDSGVAVGTDYRGAQTFDRVGPIGRNRLALVPIHAYVTSTWSIWHNPAAHVESCDEVLQLAGGDPRLPDSRDGALDLYGLDRL